MNKNQPAAGKRERKSVIMSTSPIKTKTGKRLTPQEDKFINCYIANGNATQAVIEAGYHTKSNAASKYL